MEEVEGCYSAADIAAVGIANQRETTLVWDKRTGEPLYNALVWLDTRTAGIVAQLAKESDAGKDRFRDICGLPLAQCYCAMKLRWLLDNVPAVKSAACAGTALFGTVESWLIYNLSGGAMNGGIHVSDVSNACQTMLMDLSTCTWHGATLEALDIPRSMLPRIVSNSEVYCKIKSGILEGVPIAGALGDQQAAVLGQQCFNSGQAKNTFGTSSCLLMPIGSEPIVSKSGLLTKVGFQLGPHAPVTYCFEGAAPVAGAGVSWLRDNLKVIDSARAIGGCGTGDGLVDSVDSTHGLHFVPAFTGLFTPHYCDDARGMIIGLTQYHSKAHIALAMLEAICFQCKEILDAMQDDSGVSLKQLRVDGGMVVNDRMMQIQADLLNVEVIRPIMTETTALGAAIAAGLAVGVWQGVGDPKLEGVGTADRVFKPTIEALSRERRFKQWMRAVERSKGWADINEVSDGATG